MIEGRKKRRKRGREKMKKTPQTAQTVMKQKPKWQLPCSFIHFRIFFSLQGYQLPISQQPLSPEGGTGAFSWDLQLEVSEKTCLATMAFLRKEEERTLLSALTHGRRPEQGVPPNTGCPFTKEHHRLLHLQP